jgi:LDH2 family malate/lactate/ureidoglycolate dehydrogenase
MSVFHHGYLRRVAFNIFKAMGATVEEAEIVADHLVQANLVGHDSHGVIQVPIYVNRIRIGHIVPGAPFEVTNESPATACVNGHWGFGYQVTERSMRMAIDKARSQNICAVTIFCQSHIGRLADYAIMAAKEGMIGLITADSGRGPKAVAPFGGRARRMGTNPICIAVPSDMDGPVLLDMATAAVAAGKVSLAVSRKETIPPTWVIDKDGNPTTDPNDYFDGGALLPVGADQGHKGSGLSFMVEVLSGILTGLGFGLDPNGRHNDGCFLLAINVAAFRPLADFKKEVKEFAEFVKTSPPAQGFSEVMYPGEIEWRTEQARRQNGIYVEEETRLQLDALIDELDIRGIIGQP